VKLSKDLLKEFWFLARRTFSESSEDRVSSMSASLAYYTVFCIAPLLVIAVRVAALFFGQEAARKQLSAQLNGLMGEEAAGAVFSLVTKASATGSGGFIATILSAALFGYAAIILFDELQDSMNTIWDVESKRASSWWTTLRDQLLSLVIVLATIVLFLISLVISAAWPAVNHYVSGGGAGLGRPVEVIASLVIFTPLFAIAYRFLPDAKVAWQDVWIAALLAGGLFTLGKHLLSAYLVRSSGTSIYGATGSVAVILIWVYYSARVFFLGAEFTQIYSHQKRLRPAQRN
jgi:membrane protein